MFTRLHQPGIPPSILSSFVYFEFSLEMMLCGRWFGYLQRIVFIRKILKFQSHFQTQTILISVPSKLVMKRIQLIPMDRVS
jgi:hypothetical protein